MWALLLALACALPPAQAHMLSVSHLDVTVTGTDEPVRLELDLAVRDLALTVPLDADRDEKVTWQELQNANARIDALVTRGLQVLRGGTSCRSTITGHGVRRYDDGAYSTTLIDAQCSGSGALSVRYSIFFDRDPQHRALLTIHQPSGVTTGIAGPSNPIVAIGDGSWLSTLRSFVAEGVHHILAGYDHLAFLLLLLLPSVLVRNGRSWEKAPSGRQTAIAVAKVVTAFTLAHSITLTIATLGLVTPAARWTEAAIAASVLLTALNNLRPVVTRYLAALAFSFGLIHGFGFAGALLELGLPPGSRAAALVGFNLGVELGQLMIVAPVLPLLYLLARTRAYRTWIMPLLSAVIAVLAAWWLFQRLS